MKFLIITTSLLFISIGFTQKSKINKGKCTSKDYLAEIPYEMVNHKIIIPVTIDGETYKFILDTGAPNIISKEVLEKIKYKKLKPLKVSDINNDKQKMEFVTIDKIDLGGAIFENTTSLVVEKKTNFVFTCFDVDGFIGSNLLRSTIIKFDNINKKLLLTDKLEKLDLQSPETQEMFVLDGQSSPMMEIKLIGNNGKTGKETLLFDSGMGDLFDLSLKNFGIYQRDTLFSNYDKGIGSSSIGLFADNEKQTEFRILIPELRVGGKKLENITTITTVTKGSRIGAKILDYTNLTLDYINKKFYFEWHSDSLKFYKPYFDFTATLYEGKMAIGSVWDEELSKKLEYGDLILNFNDFDIKNINLCDLITTESIFKNAQTTKMKIKKKNGDIIEIELDKKYLDE
jgi:hypothetical protein